MMKRALLKAQGKKLKYLKRIEKARKEEDSDGYLSSDDEEQLSDTMVSKVIENNYIIVKYLGRGSFSKTWMVYDYLEDRFMAFKIFDNKFEEEYKIELGNYQKLKGKTHPNLINFYGNIETRIDGEFKRGLLLELLGDSIDLLVNEEYDDKINSSIIKEVTRGILSGLDFLHSNGLVHNDMKLDNVLVTYPNNKNLEYIDKIKKLNINDYYNKQIVELTPKELQLIDKKKRKMVKRKIKEKANKETAKHFRNDIIRINNSSLENLKLNIQEIPKEEESETVEEQNLDEEETVEEDATSDEVIELRDDIKQIELNLDNISVKIIDLGNAENIGRMNSDEILTRSYRPPENILNSYYDNKADIWVVGCLLYELFNGGPLFHLSNFKGKAVEKDRYHMALMFDVLGKMPKDMTLECEFSEDIFDNKGRVIKNKGIQERNVKEELCERVKLESEECDIVYNLLRKILDYNHRTRPTCKEILESEWYSKCD
jgi:serine/threonine-protein kinase SRPK3